LPKINVPQRIIVFWLAILPNNKLFGGFRNQQTSDQQLVTSLNKVTLCNLAAF
jgi:hypothetical protein